MQLVIKNGPAAGQQYDLSGKPLTLGNEPASQISIPDPTMAGQHARFENIGGTIYVTDLALVKGTFLNGQRMSPAARYPLRPNDLLQVGSTFFQVEAPEPSAPAAAETAPPPTAPESGSPLPYQYQISTAYSPPPPPVAPPAQTAAPVRPSPVKQTKRKLNWSVVIASLFVLVLIGAAIAYYPSLSSTPAVIKNTGQITQPVTRPANSPGPSGTALPPTVTPDQAGAKFTGPTPGIGADKNVTPVQVGANDLPVYPGARRIDSPGAGVYFTQYITTDSFDKLSDWARTAFADKGWTGVEVKPLAGKDGAVLTGRKGSMNLVTYLLGPGQKDTAPYNNFFKSANVDPNGAVVVINITVS